MVEKYMLEQMNLQNFMPELLTDETFRDALVLTVGYELAEEQSQRYCVCDYSLDELDPADLTITFDPTTYNILLDHKYFTRVSDLNMFLQIVMSERVLFGQ